jgi:hypothetical protein
MAQRERTPLARQLRAVARGGLKGLLAAALFLGTVEGAIRALSPTPRVQLVGREHVGQEVSDRGVPLWGAGAHPADGAWNAAVRARCRGGVSVLFAGDSVFTMTSGAPATVVAQEVSRRLPPSYCVYDASEAGYMPYQQVEAARLLADAVGGVDLVVFGVWKSGGRFVEVRPGTWMGLKWIPGPGDLAPQPPLPVPWWVHTRLLRFSDAWLYATAAVSATGMDSAVDPRDVALQDWGAASSWAAEVGAAAIFVHAADFSAPLRVTAPVQRADVQELTTFVQDAGQHWLQAAEVFLAAGLDRDDVGSDTCCHLSPRGHEALADALVPIVLALTRSGGGPPAEGDASPEPPGP